MEILILRKVYYKKEPYKILNFGHLVEVQVGTLHMENL